MVFFIRLCEFSVPDDTQFSSLALPDSLLLNLNELGYSQMTPVQARSLPEILKGNDLIAKAKTGSGKTAAFGIGVLNKLNPKSYRVQVLVLCPTRELATQVAKELRRLARLQPNVKILTLCGGQSIGPQIGSLEHGAHIIVGTPGRIKDHLNKGTLNLSALHTLVLDEADRMLEMGFNQDIREIAGHTPGKRQTLLFSATYPDEIKSLSHDFQTSPVEVSVEAIHSNSKIQQRFIEVSREAKADALVKVLLHHRPTSSVVFCNTKQQCQDLSQQLHQAGFSARALQGDMDQKDRDMVLVQFSNRSCSVLVATDVAARGLDIEDLDAVINYDLPHDPEIYVHRIGRTGRAGKGGLALSFCTPKDAFKVNAIEDYCQQTAEYEDLELIPFSGQPPKAPAMVTLCIAGGRKQKVRPGDLLGALTGEAGISGDQVGKIDIYDFYSYVAINRSSARKAQDRLLNGKIKGRKFKVRRL
ncbi:MAG: ATP-dependent RNA helicase DbpA [Pontibacterium sp.]